VSPDLRELLPLYALDLLEPDEAAVVEQAISADPSLAAELALARDAAHLLAAAGPIITPSPEVQTRLMASVGGGRFERFSARVAQVFDVTVEKARELLGLTERSSSWENPVPGIGLIHFDGGPACATAMADCGFIRIAPGGTFPWHTHRGEELTIMLCGAMRDADGRVLRPGDELLHATASQHELVNEGTEDVIFVARAFAGIELGQRP
jgi:putative transcriptional regulator